MAEAWAGRLKGDLIEPYSAGIETHGLNEKAVTVMAEVGIDISGQRSKHVDELAGVEFDYVITLCDHASQHCPFFPGKARIMHFGFEDPPRLARDTKTEQEALECYRRVRDQIGALVEKMPEVLENPETGGDRK